MTTNERQSAHTAARAAITLDKSGDAAGRDRAMADLWAAVGYWRTHRISTTAEYRGESIPPKMIRFPNGRAQPWRTHRNRAARAWAAIA